MPSQVTGSFAELQQAVDFLNYIANDATAELTSLLAAESKSLVDEGFALQQDPYGHPWVVSLAAIKRGGQTLIDSGDLQNSWVPVSTPQSFGVVSDLIQTRILHYGWHKSWSHPPPELPPRFMVPEEGDFDIPTIWAERLERVATDFFISKAPLI